MRTATNYELIVLFPDNEEHEKKIESLINYPCDHGIYIQEQVRELIFMFKEDKAAMENAQQKIQALNIEKLETHVQTYEEKMIEYKVDRLIDFYHYFRDYKNIFTEGSRQYQTLLCMIANLERFGKENGIDFEEEYNESLERQKERDERRLKEFREKIKQRKLEHLKKENNANQSK